MVQTQCVNCQSSLCFEEHEVGELVPCAACGQFFVLAEPTAAAMIGSGTVPSQAKQAAGRTFVGATGFRWKLPTVLLLLLLAAALAAVLYGNLATKFLVPILALAAILGYRSGALRVLASFAAFVMATLAAGPLGKLCEAAFSSTLGTTGVVNRLVAVSTVAIVVLLISGSLLLWLSGRFLNRRPGWRAADRWTGSVLGTLQGALLLCLATWGVLVLDSAAKGRLDVDHLAASPDPQAQKIVQLADAVRGSMFGPLAEKFNPLDNVKAFSMPSKFLKVVNHPQALAVFVEHPAVQQIKQRPAVLAAMETLRQDPKVKDLIASGEPLRGPDLAAILSSPATLKLVDESELMAELRPISEEVERALDAAVAVADANPLPPGTKGRIPAGAISYQIHPPIQPWELTALPGTSTPLPPPEQVDTLVTDTQPGVEEPARKRGEEQRTRPRRTGADKSDLTLFEE